MTETIVEQVTFVSFEGPSYSGLGLGLVALLDGNGKLFIDGELDGIDLGNQLNQVVQELRRSIP